MNGILVIGGSGFSNRGDDAILCGMLAQLRARVGARPVTVVGGPELPALLAPTGARALTYDDRAGLARAIEDADLVIIGGGGMLYDVDYDANLVRFLSDPPDRQWLYELPKLASAARAADRPVMGYALGAGPLVSESARKMARFFGESLQALTVRDQASAELLVECGVSPARVQVAPDPAVMVEAGAPEAAQQWVQAQGLAGLPRPWIGLNLRPWFRFLGSESVREEKMAALVGAVAGAARELRARLGATVVLLPFQKLYDDDAAVLAQLQGEGTVMTELPTQPAEIVSAVGQLDLVVGMRMHSLLLAAAAGTPGVALSYAPKVTATAEALGMPMHPVEEVTAEALAASCEQMLEAREEARARLLAAREDLRAKSALSAELAAWLLEGAPRAARPAPARPAAREVKGLRVLMQTRPDFRERPGGDVVQLEELLPYLREAGVTVELTGEAQPDLSQWDLVHTINLDRPEDPYRHCLRAREQGVPVVVSPVHTDMSEFVQWGNPDYWELPDPQVGLPRPGPAPEPNPVQLRERALLHRQRQAIIDWSTVYLPNSQTDADYLQRTFGMDPDRTVVVPHGIRPMFAEARPEPFVEQYGLRDFVVCAARVEARKNQLSLIAAMRGTGIPLVIVGQPNPESYRELCRRYADDNVLFLDALPQEQLASVFAAAKVHALVSWFEVPGLTSLEAGLAGCHPVSTDRGSAQEYLQDMAWYCDPKDIDSIRRAVLAAYAAPRSTRLREHILTHYRWEQAAARTLEGYRLALSLQAEQSEAERGRARTEALRQHAEWLERLAADRLYEIQYRQQWVEQWQASAEQHLRHLEQRGSELEEHVGNLERALQQCREEFARVTSRRAYRLADAGARAAAKLLRALRVKR